MIPRAVRKLASARLAIVLIATLMLLTVLNVLFPQKTYFSAADFARFQSDAPDLARALSLLGLDVVFGGWLFAVICIILCLNVSACTWLRISERRSRGVRVPIRTEKGLLAASWRGRATDLLDLASRRLTSDGWVLTGNSKWVDATKRGAGFWGSVVLHASILVIALGGALVPLTSFAGTMVIAEGQSVIDEPATYLTVTREPRIGEPFTGAQLRLESMNVEYEDGIVVGAEGQMSALDTEGDSVSRLVRVNHPLDVAGKSYLLQNTGFAVDADLSIDGQEQAVVLNLADRTPRGYSDTIEAPRAGGGTTPVRLELTPVPLGPEEIAPQRLLSADDPRLEVQVQADSSSSAATGAVLKRGESVELSPGVTLTFREVRYWSTFLVRSEPARTVVYLGFALAVVGSLVRFISADRRIAVRIIDEKGEPTVVVGYASRPWGSGYTRDRAEARQLLRLGAEGEES
ncbi:MAG: cytochrome c biogenesis protein ResB [Anaerosomatales bacterium]|nr:cytochrome c biogenesis protein ResB [Anaerosomatales bacterium]MDT8434019.1 cytochrome c biogenesis protein ResB [Anaerosomatales bacterium]